MHWRGHERDTAHHYRKAAFGALQLRPAPSIGLADSALLLDVDGTLLELEDTPDDVVADPKLVTTLLTLNERLEGALALVSGRAVASLDRLFDPHRFAASGGHGAEVRWQGGRRSVSRHKRLPTAVFAELTAFAEQVPGVLVENKPHGVALHYRQAPQAGACCQRLIKRLARSIGGEYRVAVGKMVFEITAANHDKGTALLALLDDAVFAGRRPVYVGDDEPDEAAFRVVNDLGGLSIRVGGGAATAAHFALDDVVSVRSWLGRVLSAPRQPVLH